MINVIDEVLNTGATDNKIKYTLTHEDGTSELVQIDLATPVTTQGTPLNKALFDSIATHIAKTGTYTGNGSKTNSQFANLGYLPRLVIVMGDNDGTHGEKFIFTNSSTFSSVLIDAYSSSLSTIIPYYANTSGISTATLQLETTANGFTVKNPSSSNTRTYLNTNGVTYSYVIFE